MDKITFQAFEKLQKCEHLLRVARNQMALGRIPREEFWKREAEILSRFSLTLEEQRAYDLHLRMTQSKRHR
ncbi:hypothetical protein AV654_17885 [Paenibacillus elgii]|uniref:Uncharacterized protein n=1 Tax=Paenibacillus elgii TaxID=189691 RepID=A0A163YFC7_9BACL|nr:hypothetical protein [Paenibacillus elgii]KZE79340.1 hypothetical protein AV654_17885 [Paenibacillus elgii]